MFPKHDFSFFGVFWALFIFGLRGGKNFWTCRDGGAKNFDASLGGRAIVLEFLGVNKYNEAKIYIRGFARVIAISVISRPPTHK